MTEKITILRVSEESIFSKKQDSFAAANICYEKTEKKQNTKSKETLNSSIKKVLKSLNVKNFLFSLF